MPILLTPSGNHLHLPKRWAGLTFQALLKKMIEAFRGQFRHLSWTPVLGPAELPSSAAALPLSLSQ